MEVWTEEDWRKAEVRLSGTTYVEIENEPLPAWFWLTNVLIAVAAIGVGQTLGEIAKRLWL